MKIVAYSLVPPSPLPYLHLGYSAALSGGGGHARNEMIIFSAAGICMVLLGIVVTWRSRNKYLITLALILASFGLVGAVNAGIYLYQNRGPLRYRYPLAVTKDHQRALAASIQYHITEGISVPSDTSTLAIGFSLKPEYTRDGWYHPIHFMQGDMKEIARYKLISGGPDGRFDTGDDITTLVEAKGIIIKIEKPTRGKKRTPSSND